MLKASQALQIRSILDRKTKVSGYRPEDIRKVQKTDVRCERSDKRKA